GSPGSSCGTHRPSAPANNSAPSSNTCRLLARDHAAPESTLALSKANQPCCGRVRPLAWCSRPRSSAALLDGALGLQLRRDELDLDLPALPDDSGPNAASDQLLD